MSSAYLQAKMADRAGLADLITATLDKCAADAKEPTPEQRAQMDQWGARVTELDAEIARLETVLASNDRFEKIAQRMSDADENRERRELERRETPADPIPPTLGEAFIASPAFTEYRGRGDGARFAVDDFFGLDARRELEQRALITTTTVKPQPQRIEPVGGAAFLTPFLDLINRERVGTGSFDYVTWPNVGTGITVVPEGTAKPEVTLAPIVTTASLDTYAGWVQITRQALEDVPRVRATLELRLRQSLASALETAAATALGAATLQAATAEGLAGVREAIAIAQAAGYNPTAIALNPVDAGQLDIAVMTGTMNGPTVSPNYWGLRIVPVPGLAEGTAYVGDWSQAVTWFDRGNTDVFLSDSHEDFFIKNIFVILAEARAKFAVTNPGAAVEVTMPTTP